ncbi:mechanosensitive ion channel protein 10-like [Telopea speciosissima]|uniref:mechanosensitive ion channel protein 10-like n=1 Tax=Telopea speciosissima TaxID=54955 RepID=UPI001CC6C4E9|nr:mechanosensitive ion channel protein 10-like [Telopea speciosissima]
MEANGKLPMTGDKDTLGKRDTGGAEVVLVIPGEREIPKEEENKAVRVALTHAGSYSPSKDLEALAQRHASVESPQKEGRDSNAGSSELETLKPRVQMSTFMSCPSPEISKFTQSPRKPPKIPTEATLTQRHSLSRSVYSKPKSRFVDLSGPTALNIIEETNPFVQQHASFRSNSSHRNSPNRVTASTPRENIRTSPVTPKTPLMASPGGEEEDEEIYKSEILNSRKRSYKKWKIRLLIEWATLVCIMGFLITSLTVHKLQHTMIWGLEIWKWCVLVTVILCGRLVTDWLIHFLVFLIERNFLLKKKVLYFVYGLKQSVQVCIWLGLVLFAWALLINRGVKRPRDTTKILNFVSRAIASSLIGAFIWLAKTLLLKIVASSFHVNAFFDRIQESIFHQYVLQTLSGPPLMELAETVGSSRSGGQLSFRNIKKGEKEQEVIDVGKLHKMKQDMVSPSTMKGLIHVIRSTGLSTLSNTLDESFVDEEGEQKDKEITNEWQAKAAAYQIFRNVAKPGNKYIDEEDLRRFLNKEEVSNVLPLFEGAVETGKIKKSALQNWVVKVYLERKSLAHSLNDTKTAVKQLNTLLSFIVIVLIILLWLILMGIATTKVLVFISSQLLVVVFMFGNTCKTVFEAIIFVFVMHPFDVGDRCVIDGVQMIVEEMNILTTVFLRYDNEKIYYPNSVLSTKPISNFYRSPEMSDTVEFSVDVSTSMESIGALKARIKAYIESKPQYWHPKHSVVVKEIENVNKMKIALYVLHTMNHQNYGEKINRRSELVLELKKIFEELSIKYHLLPQEVHFSYVGSASTAPMTIGK